MKALPFNIPKPQNDMLIYQEDHEYIFYDKLHQHEEIQISYIAKGEGTLVVGDTVSDYKEGDILLIGSNLPHVFRSDASSEHKSLMLSLFFGKKSFGDHFFELTEFASLKSIFEKSIYGIKVESNKGSLKKLFVRLKTSTKIERFITLLEILRLISISNIKQLSSFVYLKSYSDSHGKRMSAIFEYTMNHYSETIDLTTIADIANMTPNAFCKYFKQRTNKTYVQFLSEVRIENAYKFLLKHKEMPIEEVALLAGFTSISNFNRKFKRIKNATPSEFRKLSISH
jgi:AraC-like DNA-binding protein